MAKRLPYIAGEWIQRQQPVQFSFEGKVCQGFVGDSISSALWADGKRVLGRSFKYHRPRGILSLANHDVNILMQDGVDTHIRADVTPVQAGMQLHTINTGGHVLRDPQRWLDWLSPILPVGFYYKAFYKPKALFPFWENIIRRAAGLGVVNTEYRLPNPVKQHWHVDVLVVGAGASGLNAALTVAEGGASVLLVDENAELGGSLGYDRGGDPLQYAQLQQLLDRVNAHPSIQLLTQSVVVGYYADHLLPVVTPQGLRKVRAKRVIVASGAFEQPPVFRHNDLPGIMLGSAAQRLVYRYSIAPFENGVVLTANDHGYRVALDLLARGVNVHTLIDMRQAPAECKESGQVRSAGLKVLTGYCIHAAVPAKGKLGVVAVEVCPYDERTRSVQASQTIVLACNGVAMSAGWSPAAALLYQSGCKMRFDHEIQQFRPERLPAGIFAAGRVNGINGTQARMQDGKRAGQAALQSLGMPVSAEAWPDISERHHNSPSHAFPMVPHAQGKNFIDFDEDIQLKDFYNAAQEGFNNIELMKRYTTFGMGPSQGKHANMNAIRVLADIRGLPVEKIGSTTARPFYHPTPIGQLAGRHFHPHRHTPMHDWHLQQDAEMVTVGAWQRPAWYALSGMDKAASVHAEVQAVRRQVGMLDASTLGKIEVRGPDAALFLERFYTGEFASLRIGRTRYALALDEAGVIIDDGVVARLDESLYYVTTSTTNAAVIYREMQRWQTQWQLDIGLVNVTSAFAAINLAGPKATPVLQTLTDQSVLGMQFGDARMSTLIGVSARIMRLGFVSQHAYEIHVPAAQAVSIWHALAEAGAAHGLRAFGTEAQRILRLEMGHLITGHDTDGLSNPYQAGLEFALAMHKPFFIGQRSLHILQQKPLSSKLVGFVLDAAEKASLFECNLVMHAGDIAGRITSISYSPSLDTHIGLAYVSPALATPGNTIEFRADNGEVVRGKVEALPFIKEGGVS